MIRCKTLIMFTAFFLMIVISDVLAGGAAARRKKMGGPKPNQQAQQTQQILQQKLEIQRQTHQQLLEIQDQQGAPDEEMAFEALWEELAASGEIWTRIVSREIKGVIVETYIDWYREQGIIIQKSTVDYMLMLDQLALQNPALFNQPFQYVLMFAAVMEYDFDNGMNKDELASQVLGSQLYEFNRQRFQGIR